MGSGNLSANFRSGNLVQGQPLGATDMTVMLSADNQFVNPNQTIGAAPAALIHLQSDNATATNRTFTLNDGQFMGQGLTLIFESGSSYTCDLQSAGNAKLTAAWQPLQYQSLNLEWNGFYWIELGRAPATTVSSALTSAHILVGSSLNVATDTAVTGDISISNAGVTAIGANKVTASMLATTIGVQTISATISLTQANIVAMGVTPVQLLAAAGAGTYYVIDQIEFIHTYSTSAYTGGGDVAVQYSSGSVVIADFADTIITAASSSNVVVKPTIYALDDTTGTSEGFATAGAVAKSVTITNAGGAFAAGNAANIAKLRLTYRVITALV